MTLPTLTPRAWDWTPAVAVAVAAYLLATSAGPRVWAAATVGPTTTDVWAVAPVVAHTPAPPLHPAAALDAVRQAATASNVALVRWRPGADPSRFEAVVRGPFPAVGRFVEAAEHTLALASVEVVAPASPTGRGAAPVVDATVVLSPLPTPR